MAETTQSKYIQQIEAPTFVPQQIASMLLAKWPTQPARQTIYDQYTQAAETGDQSLANMLLWLWQPLAQKDAYYKTIADSYYQLWGYLDKLRNEQSDVYKDINKDVLGKLWYQLWEVNRYYWPQGEATQRINTFFDQYAKYLPQVQADKRLLNSAVASKYGVSENVARRMQNQQALADQEQVLKLLENQNQQLSAVNQMYNQLFGENTKNYAATRDTYERWLADQWLQLGSKLWESLIQNILANEQLKQQLALQNKYAKASWGKSSSSELQNFLNKLANWWTGTPQGTSNEAQRLALASAALIGAKK